MKYLPLHFMLYLFFLVPLSAKSQQKNYPAFNDQLKDRIAVDSAGKLYVASVEVTGNKKTKTYIVLREMQVKKGDSILASRLYEIISQSQSLVYNSNLFSEVKIVPVLTSGHDLTITVHVKERWYIYPAPQFKLVDRNLNEWIKNYNADLNRVTYGAKFVHYNFSGRGDQLRVNFLNGYARTYAINYSAPYSNNALTEGFSVGINYSGGRDFPYKTSVDNTLLRFKKEGFVINTFSMNMAYQLRRGFFRKHVFNVQYTSTQVNDSVITQPYNPGYFNLNKTLVHYPDISYSFQYSNTNNINYPLQGKIFNSLILKRGVKWSGGINMLSIETAYRKFFTYKNNWYSSVEFLAKLKLPFRQPYINQRAMGYENFYLRGLEYYVIDGVASAISKFTLKKKLFSFNIPLPFHIKAFPRIPFTFYAKAFTDAGYAYNKAEYDTRLNNRLLYSGGLGIDILTLYDLNFRIEYSFNQLGENGLFLHSKGGF